MLRVLHSLKLFQARVRSQDLRWQDCGAMAAVANDGCALHAAVKLRGDRDVVMVAVATNPSALAYASVKLRAAISAEMAAACPPL